MAQRDDVIGSFEELIKWLRLFEGKEDVVFRGETKCGWRLMPKVGRKHYSRRFEERLLKIFRQRAFALVASAGNVSEWEFLALAQHHGLPTRLLDWSENPLVAAYFAVEKKSNRDSALIAYACSRRAEKPVRSPFEWSEVAIYDPLHITRRIAGQSGAFSIHPHPDRPLDHDEEERDRLTRVVIDKSCRLELKRILARYGIHRASLFPDLDGFAEYARYSAGPSGRVGLVPRN